MLLDLATNRTKILSPFSLSLSSIKKRKNPNATKMMISFNNNKSASKHSNRRAGTARASAATTTIAFVISVVVITFSASSSIGVVTARRDRRDDRGSIRGSYQRPNRIGSSSSSSSSSSSITQIDNNANSNTNSNTNSISNNNVLVPQCDSNNPNSYFNTNNPIDTTNDCDRFLDYCEKSMTTLTNNNNNRYIWPNDFYNTVELMYERCFKSCSDYLNGGVQEFCTMPEVNTEPALTASFNSASNSNPDYCSSIGNSNSYWTNQMISHEDATLQEMNNKRNLSQGTTCNRYDYSTSSTTSTYYPKSSPVQMNESLQCAARIQAKNIVDLTIAQGGQFPSNLHQACPPGNDSVCEDFSTRIINAGYEYQTQGFGTINEVTAAGYRSPATVIQGWLSSTSGHCSAIVKQQSLVVTTEVGIGYYEDLTTNPKTTAHVMIVAQRKL